MIQVVDASCVVAFLLDTGSVGRWCEAEVVAGDLAAPALMPFEVSNIIRRTHARGGIDQTFARQALDDLGRLDAELVPFAAVSERVWELRDNFTSYDASYVAVAELVGGRLLTLDSRVATAPGSRCPVIVAPDV